MTREEAITKLHWLKAELIKGTDLNEPIDMAIEAFSVKEHDGCDGCRYEANDEYMMPCANCRQNYMDRWTPMPQEQGWIPCSERLPDVGRDVLFSVADMYVAEGCIRADGDWTQFRWSAIQRKEEVTAWMPLPKPYREDGEA